jgi:hypothetical protein
MADSLLPDDNHSSQDREAILSKWKDKPTDELLNAKVESDLYIKTLTARLDDLKNDYLKIKETQTASDDLKALIDQMKKERENPGQNRAPAENGPTAINPEEMLAQVRKEVADEIARNTRVSTERDNFNLIQNKLKEVYGANYAEAYTHKLESLGLSKEFADNLAKTHPSVFIKTFELEAKPVTSTAPPRSNQMTTNYKPQGQVRDWNYYQEMKKSNPRLYLDPKIAVQMHNDAIELGDRFGMPQD